MIYRGFTIETDPGNPDAFKYVNDANQEDNGWAIGLDDCFLDIDNRIIERQSTTIEQLKEALTFSTAALIAAKSTLDLINVSTEVLPERIQKNEQLLKNLES